MRWGFDLADRPVRGGRMVDTATDPAYRGRGIFRDLTTAAIDIARDDIDLIFNTPNASSKPGYLKMGWTEVGTLSTSGRPVRLIRTAVGVRAALARRENRRTRALPSSDLPPAADLLRDVMPEVTRLLAARPRAADRLSTSLSGEYLRWRFGEVPGLDYRAVPVRRGGELVGLGIGRLRHRGPLAEFTLAEILHAADDVRSARDVLRAAARESNADLVATYVAPGTSTATALRRAGYLTTRRVGLTLTTRPLSELPVDPARLDAWALTLGDVEVF
jgi:hypothetical protein